MFAAHKLKGTQLNIHWEEIWWIMLYIIFEVQTAWFVFHVDWKVNI